MALTCLVFNSSLSEFLLGPRHAVHIFFPLHADSRLGFVRLTNQCSFGSDVALPGSIRSVIRFLEKDDIYSRDEYLSVEGTPIPLPTLEEVVVDVQPKRKRRLRRKASKAGFSAPPMEQAEDVDDVDLSDTDYCTFLEVAFSDPSHVGTSNASSFDHDDVQKGAVAIGATGKAQAEVIHQQLDPMDVLAQSTLAYDHEYDQIPNDDFSIATLSEEIDLTLFSLAHGPYYMSYSFADGEGSDPPKYTREEWDGPHAPEANILYKEIFKEPEVCKRAFDRTITPIKLKRTESLLPLQMSNRMSVLAALLASHSTEINSRYTALVASNARLREKIKHNVGYLTELCFEISDLEEKHKKVHQD
ncbi:hypothetical protein Tco_1007190 [Tanacetum coccineum]